MATRNSNTNLLASIAVFADLCNTETDIKSIINEFIKSIYAFEKTWALNSVDIMQFLKKHFDFDIPEAVVKNCLNSLCGAKFLVKENGSYVIIDKTYNANDFLNKLNIKKSDQSLLEIKLIEYYELICKKKINENTKKELIENFISYLLDNGVSDNYSTIISSFVVQNSKSSSFVTSLNQIKEGLIYITGLKYTIDLSNIGKWNDELTIYLDTEILFNASGYNGIVYQKLFDDFYGLINEINRSSVKKNQKKIIHLKYFTEAIEEVDKFFYVAERVIRRDANATPGNTAMVEICKGCITVDDVIRKRTAFETCLKGMGILEQVELDYYSNSAFIIETSDLFDKYKDKFDESVLIDVFHSFTKINFHRKGQNRTSFEKCKHIILTGKISSMCLSKDLEIKNEAKDIPFSTDIYFITNRLWFKLNKGLSKSKEIPSTLDIVTKAQIVLASQINKSVENRFKELKNESKSGKLTDEEAQDYYHNLREQSKRPEEINRLNVKESVEIIFEDDYESYLREKSVTKIKLDEGDSAKKELKKLKSQTYISKKKPVKRNYKVIYWILVSLIAISLAIYLSVCILLVIYCINKSDTTFTIISGLFTIIPFLVTVIKIKWIQRFNNYLKKKLKDKYIAELPKLLQKP